MIAVGSPARAEQEKPARQTITVRGGFVNDLGCIPAGAGATDDPNVYTIECWGGSTWNGGLTGHTVIHLFAFARLDGSIEGKYEESFIGIFTGDGGVGSLLTKGFFTIDSTGMFLARAKIVNGTCAFAGSAGSFVADGYELNGGYVARWSRPAVRTSDPTCVPLQLPE